MKQGAFFPIRKLRDSVNKVVKYKQIDRTHVDGMTEWQMILL